MRMLQGISSNKPRKARPFLPSLQFGNLLGLPRHGDPQGVRLAPGRQFLMSNHTHKTVKPPRPVAIYNILPRQPCFLSFLVKLSTRSSTKAIYLILPENNRTQFFAYQNKLGYLLPAESGSLVLPFDLRSLLSIFKIRCIGSSPSVGIFTQHQSKLPFSQTQDIACFLGSLQNF